MSDLKQELSSLARAGEQGALDGWNPERVRRAGTQRHHRRIVATGLAAALAVVTLGGGVVVATSHHGSQLPDPAQNPTASATPIRSLDTGNLLRTSDIDTDTAEQRIVVADPSKGRNVDESSVCLTDGLAPLGATQVLSRNFDIVLSDPTVPKNDEPIVYTQALQFADSAAASRAYETYRGWLSGCEQGIRAGGDTPLSTGAPEFVAVDTGVPGTRGTFAEVTYRVGGQPAAEGNRFESVGLTQAGDRMMVTVSLVYGLDHNVSFVQNEKNGDLPPHEQFGFIIAAAHRLG